MYGAHFGLARPPFRMTPDPELFFPGGNRGAVLEALRYAVVSGEGIIKVVGEVGSGKTMLCRMLEHELPEQCEIIYLANPSIASDQILHAIAFELGLALEAEAPKLAVLRRLQDYLLEKHAAARRVVMFVEEAQGMPLETLEELRLLSNLETRSDKLLQIVLFGQPELDEKLSQHGMRQLLDRVSYSFALPPFGAEQIRDYLNSRLRASGYRGDGLFTPGAIRAIGRRSNGLLRRINQLADKALLAAYADNAAQVTARHVRRAEQESPFVPKRGTGLALVLLVLLALALAAVGWFAWQAHAPTLTATAPVGDAAKVDPLPAVPAAANDEIPITAGSPATGNATDGDAIVVPEDFRPVPGPPLTLARVRELAGQAAARSASQDAVTEGD
ncbi:MAG: AAA family ATPase [Gammaproteobacteria bacterium]|nr:AAA family ATPase [Gammaproteobacteria bacterium]